MAARWISGAKTWKKKVTAKLKFKKGDLVERLWGREGCRDGADLVMILSHRGTAIKYWRADLKQGRLWEIISPTEKRELLGNTN